MTCSKKLVHNSRSALRAKVEVRRQVLDALTPAQAHVFDGFAGDGMMFDEVWHAAASYVGCDLQWHNDARCAYVADNRRVLRSIDLAPFTVFDFDPFGSPWEQALIVAARRKVQAGERLGLVLTEGTSLRTRFTSERSPFPAAFREAAGLAPYIVGGGRAHDEVIARALHGVVKRMAGRVVREWFAHGTTGSQMRYLSAVIEAA